MIVEEAKNARATANAEREGRVRGEVRKLPMWVDDRGGSEEVKPSIVQDT